MIDLKKEDGAVVALFAILMSSVLIIALFVMVFDVSSLYLERRVIQNTADTSVLATAQECAVGGTGAIAGAISSPAYSTGVCDTQSFAQQFAGKYANLNSPDSLTDVSSVCGTANLGQCGSLGVGQYECKSVNPAYKNYVRVKTSTRQISGTSITALFTSVIDPANANIKVNGCAQSAWGKAAYAPVILPFAIPICDYALNGTKLILDFIASSPTVTGGCSFTDLNGDVFSYASPTKGFDFLTGFTCPDIYNPRRISVGDTLTVGNINDLSPLCGSSSFTRYKFGQYLRKVVFLPVVTCQSINSNCQSSGSFKVTSFYSYRFLGMKVQGVSPLGESPPCVITAPCHTQNSDWPMECDAIRSCIYGTFERAIVPGADVSLDPTFPAVGAMAVQLLP